VTIEADRAHRLDEHPVIEGNDEVIALAYAAKSFVRIPNSCAEG
jgi:hypothetical protein